MCSDPRLKTPALRAIASSKIRKGRPLPGRRNATRCISFSRLPTRPGALRDMCGRGLPNYTDPYSRKRSARTRQQENADARQCAPSCWSSTVPRVRSDAGREPHGQGVRRARRARSLGSSASCSPSGTSEARLAQGHLVREAARILARIDPSAHMAIFRAVSTTPTAASVRVSACPEVPRAARTSTRRSATRMAARRQAVANLSGLRPVPPSTLSSARAARQARRAAGAVKPSIFSRRSSSASTRRGGEWRSAARRSTSRTRRAWPLRRGREDRRGLPASTWSAITSRSGCQSHSMLILKARGHRKSRAERARRGARVLVKGAAPEPRSCGSRAETSVTCSPTRPR